MSAQDLDPARFEAIEAFLLGTMPERERRTFIDAMEQDAALCREVEMQRDTMLSVELAGFTRAVKAVADEHAVPPARAGWAPFLKYAAMLALLLGGAIWWGTRPDAHERLYARYHVADPGLPVPMSISSNPVFHDAMVAFKMGEHEEARAKWAAMLQQRPGNDTLRYYTASALLELDSAEQAIPLFEQVAADSGSVFAVKARWYLFLACLRAGRTDQLDTAQLDDHPVYGDRVRAIMDELAR